MDDKTRYRFGINKKTNPHKNIFMNRRMLMSNYRLGIDLGGTGFQIGLINENYEIIARGDAPTRQFELSFEQVCANIAQKCVEVTESAGLTLRDLAGIGIGTPGCCEPDTGLLRFAGNFAWHNVPLGDELSKDLGMQVRVGNDANCAIIGETLSGAAKGRKNVLLFTLGTGLGGGAIINSRLLVGGNGMGAEFGHVPFVFGGAHCTCGMDGCIEAYCSVSALIRMTKEAMDINPGSMMHQHVQEHGGKINGRTSFDCAHAGDAAALNVVDEYTTNIAAASAGFINVFRPEIVLIGGGISAQGAFLLDPINEKLPRYLFAAKEVPYPKVVAAALGNDAGIIGAGCMDLM